MEQKQQPSYEEAMAARRESVEKMRQELKLLEVEAKYWKLVEDIEVANFNILNARIQKGQLMYNVKQAEKEPKEESLKARMEASREE
jgi:hypothetical protein